MPIMEMPIMEIIIDKDGEVNARHKIEVYSDGEGGLAWPCSQSKAFYKLPRAVKKKIAEVISTAHHGVVTVSRSKKSDHYKLFFLPRKRWSRDRRRRCWTRWPSTLAPSDSNCVASKIDPRVSQGTRGFFCALCPEAVPRRPFGGARGQCDPGAGEARP
jgi:hypothetical protein